LWTQVLSSLISVGIVAFASLPYGSPVQRNRPPGHHELLIAALAVIWNLLGH
jgi:hypothetical protein